MNILNRGHADKVFVVTPFGDECYVFIDCDVTLHETGVVTLRAGDESKGELAMLTIPLSSCHIWWTLPASQKDENDVKNKIVAIKGGKDEQPSE